MDMAHIVARKSRIKLTFLRGLKSLFFRENDARKQDLFSEIEILCFINSKIINAKFSKMRKAKLRVKKSKKNKKIKLNNFFFKKFSKFVRN